MAERGCPEETYNWFSIGVVRIDSGPIAWLNMRKVPELPGFPIDYVVPDPKVGREFPEVTIRTLRLKGFPLFGKVIDCRWEGEDFGLGIIDRFNSEVSIREGLTNAYDLEIKANPAHSCWVLSPPDGREPSVDRELWNCYQVIAQHLLETGHTAKKS